MDKTRKNKENTVAKVHDGFSVFIHNTFGSLAFLIAFLIFTIGWICLNNGLIGGLTPFDTFPFGELELGLSIFAIFLSVIVLISQKRQARVEKINEQVEFEVNLRSEKEITKVLQMLQRIQQKLGIEEIDPELQQMMEDLDTEKLHNDQMKATEND